MVDTEKKKGNHKFMIAFFVIPKRFERLTDALEGRCSIQLSYGTSLICGCKGKWFFLNFKRYEVEILLIYEVFYPSTLDFKRYYPLTLWVSVNKKNVLQFDELIYPIKIFIYFYFLIVNFVAFSNS